ncbi:hypothetical protein Tco_1154953 [Tanacetum coccineum]
MGPSVYPPAQQNPQPFYKPDYQFDYPRGKGKTFSGGYGEYYNSQSTLPPAWTESEVMLVLPGQTVPGPMVQTKDFFAKLPPSLSKKIEESFRTKYPGLNSGVLPAIKFTHTFVSEMCKDAALAKELRDLSLCSAIPIPGYYKNNMKKYGMRKSRTYKGKPHNSHVKSEEEKDFNNNEVKLLKELLKEKTEQVQQMIRDQAKEYYENKTAIQKKEEIWQSKESLLVRDLTDALKIIDQLTIEKERLEEQKNEEIRELKTQLQKKKEEAEVQFSKEEFLPLGNTHIARLAKRPEVHYFGNSTTKREVKGKERMVLNYKSLNDNTYKDKYSLPGINTIIKRIGGAKIFSKFDLKSRFHQVAMDEESIPWTAFLVPRGLYEAMKKHQRTTLYLSGGSSIVPQCLSEEYEDYLRRSFRLLLLLLKEFKAMEELISMHRLYPFRDWGFELVLRSWHRGTVELPPLSKELLLLVPLFLLCILQNKGYMANHCFLLLLESPRKEGHFAKDCRSKQGNIARSAVYQELDLDDNWDIVSADFDDSSLYSISEGEGDTHQSISVMVQDTPVEEEFFMAIEEDDKSDNE